MPLLPGTEAPSGARVEPLEPGGTPVPLAALATGGPALIVFYKADCPACQVTAPVLPRFAAIPALVVAAVSQDGPAETAAFARAHGWAPAVRTLRDPEPWAASDVWAVAATPTWVLLAKGGRVDAVAEGWSRDEANALAVRAAALAGAGPVVVSLQGDGGPAYRPG